MGLDLIICFLCPCGSISFFFFLFFPLWFNQVYRTWPCYYFSLPLWLNQLFLLPPVVQSSLWDLTLLFVSFVLVVQSCFLPPVVQSSLWDLTLLLVFFVLVVQSVFF